MSRTLLVALWVMSVPAFAQRIENVKAMVMGDKVAIEYDLVGSKPDARYKISLYASHNNFSYPLQRVTGDVGVVQVGTTKRIEWDVRAELVTFDGDISFEVRGVPFVALTILNPTAKGVRRGKQAEIRWVGSTPSATAKLELMKDGQVVQQLYNDKNTNKFLWSVPKSFAKGKGYQLRLSSGGETTTSQAFAVKSKIPLLLKLSPVLLLGGVLAASGGGGGEQPGGAAVLPAPENPN